MHADDWIRVKEAAELLGVSTTTIHTYRRNGFILADPLPTGRYRLLRQSVLALVPAAGRSAPE